MNLKNIDWNHVTKFSQIIAIVLFVAVFALGFELGKMYEYHAFQNAVLGAGLSGATSSAKPTDTIADVSYACDGDKMIHAIYKQNEVQLALSDGRALTLLHAVSGSGARYTNADESMVFWNKGNTAFMTEGIGAASKTTYANCVQHPIPE